MVTKLRQTYNEIVKLRRELTMKRLISGIILALAVVLAGWFFTRQFSESDRVFYTQITTSGQQQRIQAARNSTSTPYIYHQVGYDAAGKQKFLKLSSHKDKPLQRNSYLKIHWQRGKIISWQSVDRWQVPAKALTQLQLAQE
jgi:uncharacterized protein (TIGR01655 family)